VTAGVRVFTYSDDRERTLDSPTDKLLLSVAGFAAEMEREKARQRTADAILRKARAGHATGGRVFGYDTREVHATDGRRSHVERVVNEAEVVRRIFELAATGLGFKRIADRLNQERAASPLPRLAGRPRGWAASSLREVLHRELYRGVVVYGRTRKRDGWGVKRFQPRPEAEWLTLEQPALRIVSDEQCQAAHARLAQSRDAYLRAQGGRLNGRPVNGLESKYLLTGLLRCGVCGGGMVVNSRQSGTRRKYVYVCSANRFRGRAVCGNNLWAPLDAADHAILAALERDLLTPDVLDVALTEAVAMLTPTGETVEQRRAGLLAEQRQLEAELGRLTDAIVSGGGALPTLTAAIKTREARLAEVRRDLATLGKVRELDAPGLEALRADLRARLTDWRGLLRRQPTQGRQILRKLLVGRLTLTPRTTESGRAYAYEGEATVSGLLSGSLASATAVVAPRGTARPNLAIPLDGVFRVAA